MGNNIKLDPIDMGCGGVGRIGLLRLGTSGGSFQRSTIWGNSCVYEQLVAQKRTQFHGIGFAVLANSAYKYGLTDALMIHFNSLSL
jgi:hypothetical protein